MSATIAVTCGGGRKGGKGGEEGVGSEEEGEVWGRHGVCLHLGDPRDVIVLVEVGHPVRELLQVPLELLLLRPHLLL
jgi:hypothetical protein